MSARARKLPEVTVGARVLVATLPGTSMPDDWLIGEVLWCDRHAMLVRYERGEHGAGELRLHQTLCAMAAGSPAMLGAMRALYARGVRRLRQRVEQRERALNAARHAVWREIDRLAGREGERHR